MSRALEKLLSASSSPLVSESPRLDQMLRTRAGRMAGELEALLSRRNGFYAFESALHVFPAVVDGYERSLCAWNDQALWVSAYGGLADDFLFFAEDVFGGQFAIKENEVWTFDPETGEAEPLASSLEGWAQALAEDYETLTGYPLAHEWQSNHGALRPGERLVPKTPFVLGGEFDVANLHALDAVKGMLFRASLAVQIRDLPDGAHIRLQVIE